MISGQGSRNTAPGQRVADLAAELRGAGVPAGVTVQVAGVVRTAGLTAVIALGPGLLTDEVAGAVLLGALQDAARRGARSDEVADELHAVARVQTIVRDLLDGLRDSGASVGTEASA